MSEKGHDPSHDLEAHVGNIEELIHHHTHLPHTLASKAMDAALTLVGKAASWLWLVVVGLIIYAVIGRYAFGQGSVTLEEWQWHFAGAAWLLGLSYTLTTDDHVRVDVLHERFSLKTQGWVELLGILLLLLPFLFFVIYEAIPYALSSFEQGETSQAPAGLPHRWILKAILAVSFILVALATLSRLTRVTALLFGFPKALLPEAHKGSAH